MTARAARFEVVRSDAGWFARFRAANGRKVWVTEVYGRRRAAVTAIRVLGFAVLPNADGSFELLDQLGDIQPIRVVDEREVTR